MKENKNICFYGSQQKGSFGISPKLANQFITKNNPFGLNNEDVVKPSMNASRLIRKTDDVWVIDFGVDMPIEEASLYEAPFEYLRKVVFPERKNRREKRQREYWWLHARPSPRYRELIKTQERYIVSPALAKHRVFVWLTTKVLADHALLVYAREDDYFFGILQSHIHELWSLRQGTSLEDRPRYTPSTTFETFPFPWSPGQEPSAQKQTSEVLKTSEVSHHAELAKEENIAQAAKELNEKRERWLNPPPPQTPPPKGEGFPALYEKELKKRTLTNLYNQRPTWLDLAHQKLDRAVCDAYGWEHDPSTSSGQSISDEEILEKLLALNLERAKGS